MDELLVLSSAEVSGVPNAIKILPLGAVSSQKGDFVVDGESFRLMRDQIASRGVDVVIDYEHQTLKDDQAPAGGWIKEIILTDDAIMAKVEWTPKATEYLANKEYRYLSPVVMVRNSDHKAVMLHSVGLTNVPAINHMFPIVNAFDPNMKGEETPVNELLNKLIKLLGLDEGTSEEAVLDALQSAMAPAKPAAEGAQVVANKTILDLLGVPETAKTEDVAAAIVALKAPALSVEQELLALKEKIGKQEADQRVDAALKAGKIAPAQKDWATQYALKDPAGFDSFVEKAPQAVPLGELHCNKDVTGGAHMDDVTMEVCKQLGVNKDDIEKYGKADE